MQSEGRQSWVLIAIAALGLVLGVVALIVAFNAKSASDDAASAKSVEEVSTELSNLVDRLGIAEASLTGEQEELQGKAKQAERESRSAVTNLSNRLDKLERQTRALEEGEQAATSLTRQVASLENQVSSINSRIAALNQRVTKLTRRVNSSAQASAGAQTAP